MSESVPLIQTTVTLAQLDRALGCDPSDGVRVPASPQNDRTLMTGALHAPNRMLRSTHLSEERSHLTVPGIAAPHTEDSEDGRAASTGKDQSIAGPRG